MGLKKWVSSVNACGVLFDLDGVLLNSTGLHDAALKQAVVEAGFQLLPWGDEAERTSIKLQRLGIQSDATQSKLRKRKAELYLENLLGTPHTPPRWHNHWALRRAISGLPFVGLVTTMSWEHGALPRILTAMGCEAAVFDQVFAPYDGGTGKEALYAAAWGWIAAKQGVNPAAALVLEDSVVGATAAKEAGFKNVRRVTFQELGEAI